MWDTRTKWRDLEPEPGRWNFSSLDLYVNEASKRGVKVLMTLGQPAEWAAARPDAESPYGKGASSPPRSMEDWRRYVDTLARRYKGRIQAWEIWNEVNVKHFYAGDYKTLVDLERNAAEVLKAVDPSNIVLTASIQGGAFKAFDDYLAAGGGKYSDAISYHFYASRETPEAIPERVRRVREIMQKHGLGGKPIWNTEVGWLIPNRDGGYRNPPKVAVNWTRPDRDEAAGFVVRTVLLSLASGIRHIFWYSWDNGAVGLAEDQGRTLKPAAIAYRRLNAWLVGANFKGCEQLGNVWQCRIERRGREQLIVWNVNKEGEGLRPEWRSRKFERSTDEPGGPSSAVPGREVGAVPLLIE
jgi:hypothetical protein